MWWDSMHYKYYVDDTKFCYIHLKAVGCYPDCYLKMSLNLSTVLSFIKVGLI